MRILVVEDDVATARVISGGLAIASHQVDIAHDGVEGLRKALSQNYALVILDVMLPGISGIEVCAELRAQQRNMPILVLSAVDSQLDRIRGGAAGADKFLTKPFDFTELLDVVDCLVSGGTDANTADRG